MSNKFPRPSGDCITDRMRQNRANAKAQSSSSPAHGSAALANALREAVLRLEDWGPTPADFFWINEVAKPLIDKHSKQHKVWICYNCHQPIKDGEPWMLKVLNEHVHNVCPIEAHLQKFRNVLIWIVSQQNLFFAECSQAEEIIARCKDALSNE